MDKVELRVYLKTLWGRHPACYCYRLEAYPTRKENSFEIVFKAVGELKLRRQVQSVVSVSAAIGRVNSNEVGTGFQE